MKIGLPRALMYYHFFPLWESFWGHMGFDVMVSQPTNKRILDLGIAVAVSEACLPVKIFYGHVMSLAGQVDYLFIPRLVSTHKGTYICPKLMGLPDMIKHCGKQLPPIISPALNARLKTLTWEKGHKQAALRLGIDHKTVKRAWHIAQEEQLVYHQQLRKGHTPLDVLKGRTLEATSQKQPAMLLAGHPYNIFDEFASMDLIGRLHNRGYRVITPEMLDPRIVAMEAASLSKQMFWSLGCMLVGMTRHHIHQPSIAGIIHVSSFGCGPDSLVGELLERQARHLSKKPYLSLTLDEHTGEGGFVTRLEAFLDMIEWRSVC